MMFRLFAVVLCAVALVMACVGSAEAGCGYGGSYGLRSSFGYGYSGYSSPFFYGSSYVAPIYQYAYEVATPAPVVYQQPAQVQYVPADPLISKQYVAPAQTYVYPAPQVVAPVKTYVAPAQIGVRYLGVRGY